MKLPGPRLLALARLVVDPVAVARVLEPLVADWQREWLASGTMIRRAVVRTRGAIAFIGAATYCCATAEAPHDVRRRAWMTLITFVALGTIVLAIPIGGWAPPALLLYLLPSTLALSVPFATLPLAMLLGTSANRDGSRPHLVRTTIIVALVVFALHNWITPPANQAFREQVLLGRAAAAGRIAEYRPPRRGLGEMTLSEVFIASLSAPPYALASPSKVREELSRRITLPLVPVVLAILGWSLTRVSRTAGLAKLFGWWAFASVTYGLATSSGMTLERWWNTPREVAIWLPLTLWCGAIAVLMQSTTNSPGGSKDPPYTGARRR